MVIWEPTEKSPWSQRARLPSLHPAITSSGCRGLISKHKIPLKLSNVATGWDCSLRSQNNKASDSGGLDREVPLSVQHTATKSCGTIKVDAQSLLSFLRDIFLCQHVNYLSACDKRHCRHIGQIELCILEPACTSKKASALRSWNMVSVPKCSKLLVTMLMVLHIV